MCCWQGYTSWRWRGVGGYGFGVWSGNKECRIVDTEGKEKEGCSGAEAGDTCELNFWSAESQRYGSDSGGGAKHHPTRAMHLVPPLLYCY